MKILWAADFGIQHNAGGAQQSDAILHEAARERGHEVIPFHFDSSPDLLNQGYDVVVSANLETLTRSMPSLVDWLAGQPIHVRVEHDANRYLPQAARVKLFQSCKKTFFLTHFHYQQFLNHYGNIFVNVAIVPDPIDSSTFINRGEERSSAILYVGFMHQLKGSLDFFEYVLSHPEQQFVVAGWGSPVFEFLANNLDNIDFLGKIAHDKMPELYNKYEKMFYQPQFYEPFCRSVGEGLLCGIEVMGNNLIGAIHHFSERGPENFRQDCSGASSTFWNTVEGILP